ncbi:TetR/AcrR family transcriptional regulator [Actinoallomurus rhizosphaericola]|uniref:TetR/AcrR family transcriptional regulator n=1 Tax=Actinoallomurus rhizosphaericola TaxID=2952536 RepID=UPI0020937AB8|nr:TetR/AcrR family transcriptional regulator [Actinoallomurus rhizosphaericola]MCO5995565.1 TetR/AcrR family transcriptional regulator [Actinoallomurus rhizosphaericola]
MAERWTAKGAATRSRIIDAAAALIYERGLASVGINDVREVTSTSHGQIFHYFPGGRAEILRAVVERQTRQALDDQRPELDALDSWESWQAWRSRLLAVHSARGAAGGCPLGSLAAQMAESDPEAARLIDAGFDAWAAHFERGLDTMRANGDLEPTTDVPALARAILALVQGGFVLMQASRSIERLSQALDAALLVLRGNATDGQG